LIIKEKKAKLDEVMVIGDRLYTDIACGINAGVTSTLVLSGETKIEDLEDTAFQPNYVFNSIKDLYQLLK